MAKKSSKALSTPNNTLKFNTWVRLYLDRSSKDTFGNGTQSAIVAYGLDKVTQYASASQIGYENLIKLENRSTKVLETLGYDFKELMRIGVSKVKQGDYDVWERFMEKIGYLEKDPEAPTLNQFNFNLGNQIAKDRKARGLPVEEKK